MKTQAQTCSIRVRVSGHRSGSAGNPAVAVSQVGGELKYLKTAAEVVSELFRNVDLLRDHRSPGRPAQHQRADVEFKALKGIK